MATKTFGSLTGQTWQAPGNWTPSWVPGSTDDALIDAAVAGLYTVTMGGAAAAPVIAKPLPPAGTVLTTSAAFSVMPADTTGMTGGGQPFDNLQPSLAVTEVTTTQGIFPSGGGGGSASGDMLGFVYDFAGNFAPGTSLLSQGQLLSIVSNTALFSLLGTTYGGDGVSTFALPNLQGTTLIGVGTGPGLSTQTLGAATGSPTVTLTTSQIPAHDHTLPGGGVTGNTGGGQPFDNMQPSLPVERLIATSGVFPSQGGNSGSAAFLGQVASFEGNFVPGGWMEADGQLLLISQNQALFSILGTTFGGDGVTTFALPDLRGRVSVGADAIDPLGTMFGEESTTLTVAQLPAHDHTVPGGVTGSTGGGQPVTNDQPSLALNYLIATSGIFPSQGGGSGFDQNTPTLGQITEFAGNFAPSGWALANGQLLAIAQNTALFSILGTQYGGDGITTFALPDLRGRTLIGTGSNAGVSYVPGSTDGTDTTTLTVGNLPAHDHVICFCAGTRIATPSGEVPVERLAIGDAVLTQRGEARAITWIGRGRVLATRGRRSAATPVIVRKGALAENVPNRDLHVTKGHSLYLDEVLIPVEFLVNHRSIIWDDRAQEVAICHIELASHDVLLANGAPAESYRDDGNRWLFQNANLRWSLPPCEPCAPVLTGGELVDTIWRRLLQRSGPRPRLPLTDDPGLHLLIDGRRIDPSLRGNGNYVFALPRHAPTVRVASRSSVPAELGLARDFRALGVAIERIVLRRGSWFQIVGADDPGLVEGFHAYEKSGGVRWTNGDASLPLVRLAEREPLELVLCVGATTRYVMDAERRIAV